MLGNYILFSLTIHTDLRGKLALVKNFDDIQVIHDELKARLFILIRLIKEFGDSCTYEGHVDVVDGIRSLPVWVAQPFFRKPLPVDAGKRKTVVVDQEEVETKSSKIKV